MNEPNHKDCLSAFAEADQMEHDCVRDIRKRLVTEQEWVFTKGGQNDPPNFKSARKAARRLLNAFPDAHTILTLRHAALRPLREAILERNLNLVVPNKSGRCVHHIPRSVLFHSDGTRKQKSLAITPPPIGSIKYSGRVDVVVTGCLGFSPNDCRLYLVDNDAGAYCIEQMREGLDHGFKLSPHTPVVAIAADQQEIREWPASMRSFLSAQELFTPTRTVRFGRSKLTNI